MADLKAHLWPGNVLSVCERLDGNLTQAAAALGIARNTLKGVTPCKEPLVPFPEKL